MRRHTNSYAIEDLTAEQMTLSIHNDDGVVATAIFPSVYYLEVKQFNWSFKGKNGIFNEFNVSLGTFLASFYGYSDTEWCRKVLPTGAESASYLPSNYTKRLSSDAASITKPQREQRGQCFYTHKKWRTKVECETVEVEVVRATTVIERVTLAVNTHLLQYVPTAVVRRDGQLCLLDGTPLAKHLISCAGGTEGSLRVCATHIRRMDDYDFRIDPVTVRYASQPYSHQRIHRVVDEDGDACIILEQIDAPADTLRWTWKWKGARDPSEQYLVGDTGTWRRSYVIFDAKLYEKLLGMSPDLICYYKYADLEWMIVGDKPNEFGSMERKTQQLKRVLLRLNGDKVDHQYFQPRMTKAYEQALKESGGKEGFGEADRRRIKFENATSESKAKMFTLPKHSHYRRIYAHRNYFATQIYGGVGVYCKDLRCKSLLIGTNAQLQGVVVDETAQARKRRG